LFRCVSKLAFFCLALNLAGLLLTTSSSATPRYAAVVGQNCNLCHHNPTGGGMRSLYASQYLLPTRFAMKAIGEGAPAPVNPQIGDNVTIGADLRTFYLYEEDRPSGNNFINMQGSAYLAFQPDPKYSLYIHEEFGQGAAQAYELFAMGYVLPASGYLKVGKFVPSFGWKFPDHRSFVRREFVFLPNNPPHSDTGIEVGAYPGPFSIEASVLNGEFRSSRDDDNELAFCARGAWRYTNKNGFNVIAGASYYQNGHHGSGLWAGGPLASAAWKGFAWVAEMDWSHQEIPPVAGSSPFNQTGVALSQEFSAEVMRGFTVMATHDFYDPDKNIKTGSVQRFGIGVDTLPYSFLGIQGMVYLFHPDEGAEIESPKFGFTDDRLQTAIQIHFLY
jgi:hypothetical protein